MHLRSFTLCIAVSHFAIRIMMFSHCVHHFSHFIVAIPFLFLINDRSFLSADILHFL